MLPRTTRREKGPRSRDISAPAIKIGLVNEFATVPLTFHTFFLSLPQLIPCLAYNLAFAASSSVHAPSPCALPRVRRIYKHCTSRSQGPIIWQTQARLAEVDSPYCLPHASAPGCSWIVSSFGAAKRGIMQS